MDCCFVGYCINGLQKNILSPISIVTPTSFNQVFEEFWNGKNINYVYWDIDTTDWNAVYRTYKPLFAKLDLHIDDDVRKSVNYFRQITDGLIDGHYSIQFMPLAIADSFVFPALDRKLRQNNFHSPFLYLSDDSNHFDKGFIRGVYTSPTNEQVSVCGTIKNKILYFSCDYFALQEAYTDVSENSVKKTLQYFFGQLQNMPANIKALIVDIRNNRGGNIEDLNLLVGQMIDKPLHFGYTHYKRGNGRLAFTPWIDAVVTPQLNSKALHIPIIVLADNYSVSLAEAVVMAIHAMPNSTFIGETTWGATGPITDNVIYNDGQFTVPGFLSVYTSSAAFQYIDGNRYEAKGFPPDISVPLI